MSDIIIDITEISDSKELQLVLKKELGFPDFYGLNWDAFWDAITGLVELPDKLVLIGWTELESKLPDDARIMRELLDKFNEYYPLYKCMVVYK